MTTEHRRSGFQSGFTLVELIVTIVVAGILFTLLASVLGPQTVRATDPLFSLRAAELGQAYLEEILGKRYNENSPPGNVPRCGETGAPACAGNGLDAGETLGNRTSLDDVDDYNGFTDSPPKDASGATRPVYAGFSVSVSVVNAGGDLGLAAADAKRISVTVTDPRGASYVFAAYRTDI